MPANGKDGREGAEVQNAGLQDYARLRIGVAGDIGVEQGKCGGVFGGGASGYDKVKGLVGPGADEGENETAADGETEAAEGC